MDDLTAYERRFRRAGLPLLIEDYSATKDIFTRVIPLLGLVFIAEILGAIKLEWGFAANLGAAVGGAAILLGGVGLSNRLRGRRLLAIPDRVGKTELAGFVLLPGFLPLIFGGQWRSAIVTSLGNFLLLGLIYLVVGYGLPSILRWAAVRLLTELRASLAVLARAIPLLFVFALLLFLTTELWQVFADIPDAFLGVIALLFLGVGSLFLLVRIPKEVDSIEREADVEGPPLTRRQRVNVGLVMLVSQGLQVLVVSVAVGAFFVAFGTFAIDASVREAWIGHPGQVLVTLHLFGHPVQLTTELLKVSGALASFTGLYYAISVLTDETYRTEFLEQLKSEMRGTFHARAEYLRLRARGAGAVPSAEG